MMNMSSIFLERQRGIGPMVLFSCHMREIRPVDMTPSGTKTMSRTTPILSSFVCRDAVSWRTHSEKLAGKSADPDASCAATPKGIGSEFPKRR